MGLRPHEERILGQIERTLSACDPKLAEVLSTFTRLTAHERIPAEGRPLTVPAARNDAALRAASRPGLMSQRGMMPGRNSRILQVVLVMAAVGLFALCLITLSGTGGSREVSPSACTMAWTYVPPCQAGGFSDQVHHPTGPDKNRTLNRLTIGSSPGGRGARQPLAEIAIYRDVRNAVIRCGTRESFEAFRHGALARLGCT